MSKKARLQHNGQSRGQNGSETDTPVLAAKLLSYSQVLPEFCKRLNDGLHLLRECVVQVVRHEILGARGKAVITSGNAWVTYIFVEYQIIYEYLVKGSSIWRRLAKSAPVISVCPDPH